MSGSEKDTKAVKGEVEKLREWTTTGHRSGSDAQVWHPRTIGVPKHPLRYLRGTTELTLTFDAKASQSRIIKTFHKRIIKTLHTAHHQVASYSASSRRFIQRLIKSLHTASHQVS
jgi:hypothetical protein